MEAGVAFSAGRVVAGSAGVGVLGQVKPGDRDAGASAGGGDQLLVGEV